MQCYTASNKETQYGSVLQPKLLVLPCLQLLQHQTVLKSTRATVPGLSNIPVEIGLEEYEVAQRWHNEAQAGARKGANQGNEEAKARDPCRNQGYEQHQANAHCSKDCGLGLGAVLVSESVLRPADRKLRGGDSYSKWLTGTERIKK